MKISIITPVYDNGKEYQGLKWLNILNTCLENQIEKDFEWILVYDGINEQCKKQTKNYINAKYFELEKRHGNWGNYARDFGLKQAKGQYIVFIDQDNIIFENYLSDLSYPLDIDLKIGFILCSIYCSFQNVAKILKPKLERGGVNTLCFMVRKEIMDISGWWSINNGQGDEYFIIKNLVDSGSNGLCICKESLAIWNGARYKYPKEIYPSFINYSNIEELAGDEDKDTRKDKDLWFSL